MMRIPLFLTIVCLTAGFAYGIVSASQPVVNPGVPLGEYLSKQDALYATLTARVLSDLHGSAKKSASESSENKIIEQKAAKATPEQQKKLSDTWTSSLDTYVKETGIRLPSPTKHNFLQNFQSIGAQPDASIKAEYDLRVRNLGNNRYAVDFYYDALSTKIAASRLAMEKSIAEGAVPRYTHQLSLIYMMVGGQPVFRDPFAPLYAFAKTL